MKVYFASDHAGFELKNELLAYVRDELSLETEDCGAASLEGGDDYPEIIANAARKLSADVAAGTEARAILLGASGQGEAIVANKFALVRAVVYYGPAARAQHDASGAALDMIASTRMHNDANALAIGARFVDAGDAKRAVNDWLIRAFSGEERHIRRIQEIHLIEDSWHV